MTNIAKIYNNKKITFSADASVMFYSLEYNEAYRAKSIGAFTESYHKFVKAGGILEKTASQDVRILDICFGLGYNCAVTFEYTSRIKSDHRVHIVSIEKDPHLPQLIGNMDIMWPIAGYGILKECLGFRKKNAENKRFTMEMYLIDAIEALKFISGKFDAIYFDPFSYSKNPEMWSIDIFLKMAELLAPEGRLVTYACGKVVRNNMTSAGFTVSATRSARGAFHPGTVCTLIPPYRSTDRSYPIRYSI